MSADGNGDRRGGSRPRPLRQVLRSDRSTLGRIGGHARNLGRLQRQLQKRLPDALAGHWQLAGLSADALTLVAETPAWASRLRFMQTQLLADVEGLTGVRPRRCELVVDPPRLKRRPTPREPVRAETSDHLHRFAESQTDERLRAALRRLASHVGSRDDSEG